MEHEAEMESRAAALEKALLAVDRPAVRRAMSPLLKSTPRSGDLERLIVLVLERIGDGWETGQVSLAQVYMAGRQCEELLNHLWSTSECGPIAHPPIAIAVLEDYHMLGQRMVGSVLKSAGFELRTYGRVTVEELVSRVRQDGIAVLLISALMLPSALRVRDVVDQLKASGNAPKVLVGGAPFRLDPRLADEVGADACGQNASDAIALTRRLLGES